MLARHPFVVVAVALAVAWYFLVGAVDRGLLVRQSSISMPCLDEYLPSGTIYTPEGSPSLPSGDYRFFPLGIDCTFRMTNGTTQNSFHPHHPQLVLGLFPLASVAGFVTTRAIVMRKRARVTPSGW